MARRPCSRIAELAFHGLVVVLVVAAVLFPLIKFSYLCLTGATDGC
jgi:hypothetical protein